MLCDKKIDKFLESATKGLSGLAPKEFWPLNPAQLTSYFDADLSHDYYKKIKVFREEGLSGEQLAEKISSSHLIYDFLINYACIGFKVLHNFDIAKIDFDEREDFFNFMLEVAEHKEEKSEVKILDEVEDLKKYLIVISEENRKIINKFKTALFGLNWSYYYDTFAVCGSDTKRPINIQLDKGYTLVLDEYYNQKPITIWPYAVDNFFEEVRIYNFYEKFDYEHNIFGRLKTGENLGQKIKKVIIIIDNQPHQDECFFTEYSEKIFNLTIRQSEYVNALTDLEKVEKAMFMNYFMHKEILGEEWEGLFVKAKKNLEIFGDKFIKEQTEEYYNGLDEAFRRFDPRNNWF